MHTAKVAACNGYICFACGIVERDSTLDVSLDSQASLGK